MSSQAEAPSTKSNGQTCDKARPDETVSRLTEKRAPAEEDTSTLVKKPKTEAMNVSGSEDGSEESSASPEDQDDDSEEDEERETCENCGEEVDHDGEACCKARRLAQEAYYDYGNDTEDEQGTICDNCGEEIDDKFDYCCKSRRIEQEDRSYARALWGFPRRRRQ